MKHLIKIIIASSTLFSACSSPAGQPLTAVLKDTTIKNAGKSNAVQLNYPQATLLDSSEYVMYPLAASDDDDDGGSFKRTTISTYWNIIFFNTITKKYHLLNTGKKMLINGFNDSYSSYEYDSNVDGRQGLNYTEAGGKIFYSVTATDYNHDGKLNDLDPKYLFISDRKGENFRQISPDNFNVIDWQLIKKSGKG